MKAKIKNSRKGYSIKIKNCDYFKILDIINSIRDIDSKEGTKTNFVLDPYQTKTIEEYLKSYKYKVKYEDKSKNKA